MSKSVSAKPLHIASCSDIHLGHNNTPTKHILKNLNRAFPDNEETGKLDIIWIGGDLFDQSLALRDPNVFEIKRWIHRFLRICAKRNILVRVLEGTPSHDWGQNRLMVSENDNGQLGCDLKYIDTLSIEYVEKLGIHVLYVPDEWRHECDDTWLEVQQLLKANNLEQVDYTILHGSFTHQLPSHVKVPMHVPERYLSITRRYVFGAHIHQSSVYGQRLLANGSFDRLSHNEEAPKGHWRVVDRGGEGDDIVFVENKDAMVYKTIDCTGLSVEDALLKLESVTKYPDGSHMRVAADKTDPILSSLDVLRKTYPQFKWTSKAVEQTAVQSKLLVDLRTTFHQINITPNNIAELLMSRLRAKSLDENVLKRCSELLMEIVQ